MAHYRIIGQKPLHGTVAISGRKNAALKLIAATILSNENVTLRRIPEIGDVRVMLDILQEMGASVTKHEEGTFVINTSSVTRPVIPEELGRKLRASLVLVGPLLARFGTVTFPHPGGCVIGKRSIAPHLEAFRELGAEIEVDDLIYTIHADRLAGSFIYLKERSVTATENLIMAATRAHGTTQIYWAAEEPHIRNLCDILRSMGYAITGDGTSMVSIEGKPDHAGTEAEATVIADDIEVGTFAAAAVVTGGDVVLQGIGTKLDIIPILSALENFNVNFSYSEEAGELHVLPSHDLHAADIQTNPWPGFPPDLQSPFTVIATQARGTSLIHDWMYEGRLYFVDLLQKMGANIIICDPHRAIVTGPTPLIHSSLITPDLRAGAALVIAALAAEGTSIIEHTELIERGYANIDGRLRSLGADIIRES
jgi:UDP-N-acetylglucosamine 1-carboxyvinyltransferase